MSQGRETYLDVSWPNVLFYINDTDLWRKLISRSTIPDKISGQIEQIHSFPLPLYQCWRRNKKITITNFFKDNYLVTVTLILGEWGFNKVYLHFGHLFLSGIVDISLEKKALRNLRFRKKVKTVPSSSRNRNRLLSLTKSYNFIFNRFWRKASIRFSSNTW